MNEEYDLFSEIKTLLDSQHLAVLSSYDGDSPYMSLLAFCVTDDLKHVLLVTERDSTKYRNIQAHPKIALLIDDRTHSESDFEHASAITVCGEAREADGVLREQGLSLFLERHPTLCTFALQSSTAVVAVHVERYVLVDHFQRLREVRMR